MVSTDSWVWTNTGTEPTQGDETYVAQEQPIAEYDNWAMWAVTSDIDTLASEVTSNNDLLYDTGPTSGEVLHTDGSGSPYWSTVDAMQEHGNEWHTDDYLTVADVEEASPFEPKNNVIIHGDLDVLVNSTDRGLKATDGDFGVELQATHSGSVQQTLRYHSGHGAWSTDGMFFANGAPVVTTAGNTTISGPMKFSDNVEVDGMLNSDGGGEVRLELRTSDPSNPTTGQIWIRTDL